MRSLAVQSPLAPALSYQHNRWRLTQALSAVLLVLRPGEGQPLATHRSSTLAPQQTRPSLWRLRSRPGLLAASLPGSRPCQTIQCHAILALGEHLHCLPSLLAPPIGQGTCHCLPIHCRPKLADSQPRHCGQFLQVCLHQRLATQPGSSQSLVVGRHLTCMSIRRCDCPLRLRVCPGQLPTPWSDRWNPPLVHHPLAFVLAWQCHSRP
mmetsp:Transcript_69396/g.180259  ORF Transcript_69396/g.180259 Transcript_69396/m.180259 type:complete len:208 (-) Transcript_69396:177-800(-)